MSEEEWHLCRVLCNPDGEHRYECMGCGYESGTIAPPRFAQVFALMHETGSAMAQDLLRANPIPIEYEEAS